MRTDIKVHCDVISQGAVFTSATSRNAPTVLRNQFKHQCDPSYTILNETRVRAYMWICVQTLGVSRRMVVAWGRGYGVCAASLAGVTVLFLSTMLETIVRYPRSRYAR